MTAIKTKHEYATLDLNKKQFSKSSLQKTLQGIKLAKSSFKKDGASVTLFITTVRVGVFDISLNIYDFVGFSLEKGVVLSDVENFDVSIWETNAELPIDIEKNDVFKNQKWVQANLKSKMTINELSEAIMYCRRVSNIKSFL